MTIGFADLSFINTIDPENQELGMHDENLKYRLRDFPTFCCAK